VGFLSIRFSMNFLFLFLPQSCLISIGDFFFFFVFCFFSWALSLPGFRPSWFFSALDKPFPVFSCLLSYHSIWWTIDLLTSDFFLPLITISPPTPLPPRHTPLTSFFYPVLSDCLKIFFSVTGLFPPPILSVMGLPLPDGTPAEIQLTLLS